MDYRRSLRHTFALVATAAALLLAAAAARPASAGEKLVKLRGTIQGDVTATPIAPPIFRIDIEGGGHANRLGNFSVSIPHVVDRSVGQAVGTYVFNAANGDTLTADFTGQSAPSDTPGFLTIVEHATITGGTGRFADAEGEFTVEREFDIAAGTTTGTFDGTISTVGSNKQ